jgi:DNA-binding transcriptional MocR family regulator
MNWNTRFSDAASRVADADAVIGILKLAEQPGIISLAGGLPDPGVFRIGETREAMARVLTDHAPEALNYSPNPGITALREFLAGRLARLENIACSPDEILVCSGGLEGIRHAMNALVNGGDPVLVEDPTYMVALQVCRELGGIPTGVASDGDGMIPEALDETASRLAREGRPARVLYVGPTFQNPTGRTWTLARREALLEVADRHDLAVIEDHAYGELRYDGAPLPSLKSLAPERVIFVHTFSKIFGPGLRLGWVAADRRLIERLGLLKLGTDQCSGALVQRLALAYGEAGGLDAQVERARALYRRKRDAMLDALADLPVRTPWTRPEGGFFLWAELDCDTEALLLRAIERHRVAFVAGNCFFADPASASARVSLRLSFSYVAEDRIGEAIRRLGAAVRESAAV